VARAIAAHARDARVLELMARREVRTLPARRGGAWEMHDGDDDHGGEQHADPHIWLAPDNALAIIATVAEALAAVDPANGTRYAANARAVARRIRALDGELAQRLASVRTRRYLVFHDAYRYFEDHYRLSPLGAVSVVAGRAPGARRLIRLRRLAKRADVRCIFREPQFAPAAVATIRAGTGLAEAVLDPLGADIPPGPDHWFALMRNLADGLVSCLSGSG
jgi:zinc transport system substrate-binding protein